MKLSFSRKKTTQELEELMAQEGPRVYQHLVRMVQDSAEAEDLSQEVFVKAWQKWDSFRGESHRSTWLLSIATNEALQALRKRKNRFNDPDQLSKLPAPNLSPDATALEEAIELAIQQLPEKQKAIFSLRYYEEMPYSDMAEAMGGTEGSLKASFHHARKKVEEILRGSLNL